MRRDLIGPAVGTRSDRSEALALGPHRVRPSFDERLDPRRSRRCGEIEVTDIAETEEQVSDRPADEVERFAGALEALRQRRELGEDGCETIGDHGRPRLVRRQIRSSMVRPLARSAARRFARLLVHCRRPLRSCSTAAARRRRRASPARPMSALRPRVARRRQARRARRQRSSRARPGRSHLPTSPRTARTARACAAGSSAERSRPTSTRGPSVGRRDGRRNRPR